MHHCAESTPNDPDPEAELAVADAALAAGDWRHALHHYAGALGCDARDPRAHAGVRRVHADHDVLAALADDTFVGAQLARALLFADRGDFDMAYAIAASADLAMPHVGAVHLMVAWCDRAPPTGGSFNLVVRCLAMATEAGAGRLRLLPGERAAMAPYAALAERVVPLNPSPVLVGVLSGLLRRAGRYDDAIRAVEAGSEALDASLLTQVALAHRAAGRADRAVEIFEHLVGLTGQLAPRMELARALAAAGRYAEAADHLRRALAERGATPDYETAVFGDWIAACAQGDARALARDYDWVRRSALLHFVEFCAGEVSTNWLRESGSPRGQAVPLEVTELEAPSARLCFALHQGSGDDVRAVPYAARAVPTPDPRVPSRPVSTLLWREADGVMVQAVPPPPPEVIRAVTELAWGGDLCDVWEAAGELAARAHLRVDHLASAMVHPCEPPAEVAVDLWVFHAQVTAACLLARAAPVWATSPGRPVLLDLLHGPRDWTTAAAVVALGELAARDADALPEVCRALIGLAKTVDPEGYCCYATALALAARKVPLFPPGLVESLGAWIQGV